MKTTYWKTDFSRCFFSWQMLIAVGGVCAVHFLVPQQITTDHVSVLQSFNRAWGSNGLVLAYLFTTLAYGPCFAEDLEQGYIKYAVIRGKAVSYAISKCICIAISSELAMTAGRMLFIVLLRCFYPWTADVGELVMLEAFDSFCGILDGGHYITYVLLHGMCQGMWAVVLALLSAFVSLFVNNRLLVLAFPVMAHHLLRRSLMILTGGSNILDPDHLFLINYNRLGKEWLSLAAAVGISLTLSLLISYGICRSVKRRATNG